VKIKLIHDECGREVLVRQVLDSGGHCPWDGKAFNSDYTAVLAEQLELTENAGTVLEGALEQIVGMEPAFTIDPESLIAPLQEQVDLTNAHRRPARSRR
jgi:hypothetical protein